MKFPTAVLLLLFLFFQASRLSSEEGNPSNLDDQVQTHISGLSVRNVYDENGRRTGYFLPDGSFVTFQYNESGYMQGISRFTKEGELCYSHEYANFNATERSFHMRLIGNAGHLSLKYDDDNHCRAIISEKWREEIPDTGFDEWGRLILMAFEDTGGEWQLQYVYDDLHRLIQEQGACLHTYAYNQQSHLVSRDDTIYLVNELGQLICQSSNGKTLYYRYDERGNLIEKSGDEEAVYSYDAFNNLISIHVNGSFCIHFSYDSFQRRLSKQLSLWDAASATWLPAKTIFYLYDQNREIGTVDEAGNLLEFRLLGQGDAAEIGSAVAFELGGEVYAPIHDHRGNVCCLLNAHTGDVAEYYRYSAFGECTVYSANGQKLSDSAVGNPWRFLSKRQDPNTGLVYCAKRNYDPACGQWISGVPQTNADALNFDGFHCFSFSYLWNEFSMKQVLESCAELLCKFKKNFSYTNYMRSEWDTTITDFLGGAFLQFAGYYSAVDSQGTYNPDNELNNKVRITLVNGIMNLRSDLELAANEISNAHGGNSIHFVFRPTGGWTADILNGCIAKLGFVTPQARLLVKTWKRLIREMGGTEGGGRIIHYAHSIGATDTYSAINLLSHEERKMIHVVTLGSPSLIPATAGFASVVNYVSKRDGVCLLDPIGYIKGWLYDNSNVRFLGSIWGIPLIDHSLLSESYLEVIKRLGDEFLNIYVPFQKLEKKT